MATFMTAHSYTLVDRRDSLPGTPSHSPPPSRDGQKLQVSPANSDDSSIADLSDLSFNYERNSRGEIVRVSKGSSKSSTPPTPSDTPPRQPSPKLAPPTYSRPAPLARSESLPQESLYHPRQFQRVASGPMAITPVGTSRGFSQLASTNAGTGRKIGGPRRVRLDEIHESEPQHHKLGAQNSVPFGASVDEKENQRAARMIRPARSVGKQLGSDRIAEVSEDEPPIQPAVPPHAPPYIGGAHHAIRPRRSASLSDAPPLADSLSEKPAGHMRPGTSLGARRVTLEEKMRQEREIALEEGYANARREAEEAAARAHGHAPSPTHLAQQHLRHQRKDSDTMRGQAGSPTVVEGGRHRRSDPALEAAAQKNAQWNDDLPMPVTSRAAPSVAMHGNSQSERSKTVIVNKKSYQRLDVLGRGGSSRVHRVISPNNETFALKRVSLDKVDQETIAGYMNEISLLKRLEGNQRIIRLFDSEVKQGSGGSKGQLLLVMECGEVDLARLLMEQQKEPFDPVWVAYYWKQMLQAVQVIHEEKIVHSDLKPANFVVVKGQLKLIDFGIANAIANDTTNIQRDHQIGTVNYMSPEAIELSDGNRRLKVGRPSDVWSLGCILYQMVYGSPPFSGYQNLLLKLKLIPDENHVIDFPEYAVPLPPRKKDGSPPSSPPPNLDHLKVRVPQSIINTMKSCLIRNPKARATIPTLLQQNWLEPEPTLPPLPPPPPPPPRPRHPELTLKDDETIINPHYMQQLLTYGIRLVLERPDVANWTDDDIKADAERLVMELKNINRNAALVAQAAMYADDDAP